MTTATLIPSITSTQLKIIRDASASFEIGIHDFTWVIPDIDKDEPLVFAQYSEGNNNIDHLISLKLVEDVSAEHEELLTKIRENSGRVFRKLRITALAKAMFMAWESGSIH
jgi:phosphoenolpyruvate synthase/pyruvate phosphate dikinase